MQLIDNDFSYFVHQAKLYRSCRLRIAQATVGTSRRVAGSQNGVIVEKLQVYVG